MKNAAKEGYKVQDLKDITTSVHYVANIHSTLASLKIKETDRIEALKKELKKVGYVIYDENDNTLIWDGETCEPSFEPIDTYEDHRMALAFAPLAFKFPQIEINNPEVVSKSYPHYWEDLKKVGFEIVES